MLRAFVPLALFAAMTASCLITSTPNFRGPDQTAPLLLATGATPDLGGFVVIRPNEQSKDFSAFVRSEDANAQVRVEILIDYGFKNADGRPFSASRLEPSVAPSTFDNVKRLVTATVSREAFSRTCQRVTLMVSHDFVDGPQCPADLADSSFLTWNVVVCNGVNPCPPMIDVLADCVPIGADGKPETPATCPPITQTVGGAG